MRVKWIPTEGEEDEREKITLITARYLQKAALNTELLLMI